MGRYYKVRLPKRVASEALKGRRSTAMESFDDYDAEPGVTFRVSDLQGGRVPTESTVGDLQVGRADVGLSPAEAAELMASMAAAERADQPDRLPIVVALVMAVLFVVLASGVVQSLVGDAREQLIEERIKRPRAQHGWSERTGATRKALGLPEQPAVKIDYIAPKQPFFPALD